MTEYISKSAVVAEIERNKKHCTKIESVSMEAENMYSANNYQGRIDMCNIFLSYIDTLEVKEVDLEKELNDFIEEQKAWVKDDRVVEYNNGDSFNHIYDLESVARHFFELGMHVSNKAQKGEKV